MLTDLLEGQEEQKLDTAANRTLSHATAICMEHTSKLLMTPRV